MKKIDNLHKKIYKKINEKMRNEKIILLDISKKIGISQSAICQQLKKLSNGKAIMTDSLFKIAGALEIEPSELFK